MGMAMKKYIESQILASYETKKKILENKNSNIYLST